MLLLISLFLRGVRLLTDKINQVRCFDHGALPAPWFFVSGKLESTYGCHRSSTNLF